MLLLHPLAAAADPDAQALLASVRMVPESMRGTEGFFRCGQDADGRWWFVAPDGKPFFYKGVVAINRSGLRGGRRALPGPYTEAIDRIYGKAPEGFRDAALARARSWGFNALGAWTGAEFFDQGMPYVEIIEFAKVQPSIGGSKMPDLFDPAWEKAAEEHARVLCEPRRESRQLVGYYTDNELGWSQPKEEDLAQQGSDDAKPVARRVTLLQKCLCAPDGSAAWNAAWDFVLKRHGTLAKAAAAWGVQLPTKAAVRKDAVAPAGWPEDKKFEAIGFASDAYLADSEAFSRDYAKRYFAMTSAILRRLDPNHLILGCRFSGPPGDAIMEFCRYPEVDVLSMNDYTTKCLQRIDSFHKAQKMPILIGEFCWNTGAFLKRPKPKDGPEAVAAKAKQMQAMGESVLTHAFTHPALVGYTWYRWVSVPGDLPPASEGVVNIDDSVNTVHTETLTRIHAKAEAVKLGVIPPSPRPQRSDK